MKEITIFNAIKFEDLQARNITYPLAVLHLEHLGLLKCVWPTRMNSNMILFRVEMLQPHDKILAGLDATAKLPWCRKILYARMWERFKTRIELIQPIPQFYEHPMRFSDPIACIKAIFSDQTAFFISGGLLLWLAYTDNQIVLNVIAYHKQLWAQFWH